MYYYQSGWWWDAPMKFIFSAFRADLYIVYFHNKHVLPSIMFCELCAHVSEPEDFHGFSTRKKVFWREFCKQEDSLEQALNYSTEKASRVIPKFGEIYHTECSLSGWSDENSSNDFETSQHKFACPVVRSRRKIYWNSSARRRKVFQFNSHSRFERERFFELRSERGENRDVISRLRGTKKKLLSTSIFRSGHRQRSRGRFIINMMLSLGFPLARSLALVLVSS